MSGGGGDPADERLVAVLSKRGRFWAARPLFARRRTDRDRPGRASPEASATELALGSSPFAGPRPRGGSGSGGGRSGTGRSDTVKGAPGGLRARDGDLVVVRVGRPGARRSRHGGGPRLWVERVIGRPEVAADVIEALLIDRGCERGFPDEVSREASRVAGRARGGGREGEDDGRRDLTDLVTFTIDPVTARDFDDAISARRLSESEIRVWVHIADVCAHVREGSALDREALRRATSVYVPGTVEAMLPEALSNDVCSLVEGSERLVVTVEMDIRDGEVVRSAFYRSTIRSDARLDYEEVDRVFAASEGVGGAGGAGDGGGEDGRAADVIPIPAFGREGGGEVWRKSLDVAREAARQLTRARLARAGGAALTIGGGDVEFLFDRDGNVDRIAWREQTESHRLIEALMIAANESVARFLSERRIPCLYRVHERPDPERVKQLVDRLASLGVATVAVSDHLSPSEAAQLIGVISRRVEEHIARRVAKGLPGGRGALTSLVLRAVSQAYYSPKNLGHAGLGSSFYCHFTSPIRRYPDIVCHRALLSALGADQAPPVGGELVAIGEWTSERERDGERIERDGSDVARAFALESMLMERGWDTVFEGEVVGLISAGAFVVFGESGIYRGMVPVRSMVDPRGGRDWWEVNEEGTVLHGERSGATIRLGDAIEVVVVKVDAVRGRVDLGIRAPGPGRK